MTILSLVLLNLAKVTTAIAMRSRTNDILAKRTASLQLEANKFGAVPFSSLAGWSTTDQTVTRGNFTYKRHLVMSPVSTNALLGENRRDAERGFDEEGFRDDRTDAAAARLRRYAQAGVLIMTSRRQGFTLAEVVISLVIAGIIGAAFTKLLMSQNRYFDHEMNLRTARSIARSASNVLMADLRMVQDSGGVDSVTPNGKLIRVLVPYRFGIVCGTNGSTTTVSMLPTDSGTIAVSVYRGFAWRDSTSGRYTYLWPGNPTGSDIPSAAGNAGRLHRQRRGQAQIRTVSVNGRSGDVLDLKTSGPSGARVNSPVFFWQHITYSFRASSIYPNRMALWRNVEGGRNEELMAPFDTSAGFRFYKPGDDVSRTAPPPVDSNSRHRSRAVRAQPARRHRNDSTRLQSRIVTSIFFKNVRAF